MADFSHILNWKLLRGSHEFPGPDGGTCVTEAAIVAAGFTYRKVLHPADCPPCFSIPVTQYAMALNDSMPDEARHRLLLPFVTHLAGTAASIVIENQRAELIVLRTIREILPSVLSPTDAHRCASVGSVGAAVNFMGVCFLTGSSLGDSAASHAKFAIQCLRKGQLDAAVSHAASASVAATRAANDASVAHYANMDLAAGAAAFDQSPAWPVAVDILREAIAMSEAPIDIHVAAERLERVKKEWEPVE